MYLPRVRANAWDEDDICPWTSQDPTERSSKSYSPALRPMACSLMRNPVPPPANAWTYMTIASGKIGLSSKKGGLCPAHSFELVVPLGCSSIFEKPLAALTTSHQKSGNLTAIICRMEHADPQIAGPTTACHRKLELWDPGLLAQTLHCGHTDITDLDVEVGHTGIQVHHAPSSLSTVEVLPGRGPHSLAPFNL